MSDIVISEFMDEGVIARDLAGRDVLYDTTLVDDTERLHNALADARALIVRNRTQVRSALLAAAPGLTVVGRLGVGLDNIDMQACAARGIAVCPAKGANDASVAEYVIAAAMMLVRGVWRGRAEVEAGAWPRMAMIGGEVGGRQLGLIGYGGIARQTARRALALDMTVAAHDPFIADDDPGWGAVVPMPLSALIETSDIVSLHLPLSDATRHLIGAGALAQMKPGAILINAARGGIVDEAALVAALKSGHLAGAALDVFETEPLTAPAGAAFADIPNLLLTPHIAGVTAESNVRVSAVTVRNVLAALDTP